MGIVVWVAVPAGTRRFIPMAEPRGIRVASLITCDGSSELDYTVLGDKSV